MALEDETLALPALAPEFAVQGVGDGTLPVELNDPVVKDDALELRPLAEAAAAVVVHEGVLNHLERRVFHEAQRRAQVDGIVNVGAFDVCRRPQIDISRGACSGDREESCGCRPGLGGGGFRS
jgi:hypothetical protein